jgi:hypothetical protein
MSIFDSDTFNNVLAPSVAAPQADEIGVSPDATSLEVVQARHSPSLVGCERRNRRCLTNTPSWRSSPRAGILLHRLKRSLGQEGEAMPSMPKPTIRPQR